MRTSSKQISPWLRARWPILSRGLPRATPCRLSGTSATPPPAELLEQDVLLESAEAEAAQLDGNHRPVVAEAIGVAQRAPERGPLRDHLGWVSQPVECHGGRAEHLGGEAVRRLAERRLLGGQVQVELAVHARVPQHI